MTREELRFSQAKKEYASAIKRCIDTSKEILKCENCTHGYPFSFDLKILVNNLFRESVLEITNLDKKELQSLAKKHNNYITSISEEISIRCNAMNKRIIENLTKKYIDLFNGLIEYEIVYRDEKEKSRLPNCQERQNEINAARNMITYCKKKDVASFLIGIGTMTQGDYNEL